MLLPGSPLILCQFVVSIMCSSLRKSDKNSFSLDVFLTTNSSVIRPTLRSVHIKLHIRLSLSPQQQVDEHSDGEEGAPDGGVAAQEEEEVAEKAEEDHPDHMELKEQVEGVETSRHRSQVFHERGEA